jgi:hypothetical protein
VYANSPAFPEVTEQQARPTQTDPSGPEVYVFEDHDPSGSGYTTTMRTTTSTIVIPPGGANQFHSYGAGGPTAVPNRFGSFAPSGPAGVQSRPATLEQLQQMLRTQTETLQRLRARRAQAAAQNATAGTSSSASPPNTWNNPFNIPTARATSNFGSNMSASGSTASAAAAASRPSPNLPTPEQTIRQNLEHLEALRRAQAPVNDSRNDTSARRRVLLEDLRELEEEEARFTGTTYAQASSAEIPIASQQITFSQHPIPPNALVFLLQDQMGRPHSLLVGPAGSALTSPPVYNPGFQYPIPNGQPYNYMNPLVPSQIVTSQMQQPQQPGVGVPPANNPQPAAAAPPNIDAIRREILAMNQNAQMRQINIPRLFRDRAGHLWLAIKLSVFVLLFAGNGGWRRILYLGTVAFLIFLWQTGLLNELMRPLLDAIYPPLPQPQPAPNAAAPQPQPQPQPQMDPANTAAMLINRQEDRMREIIRNAERAFMIFMASLIPGWHDRHVNAIERQQQLVREQQQREQQQREQQQREQQVEQEEQVDLREEPQPAEPRGAQVVEGVL